MEHRRHAGELRRGLLVGRHQALHGPRNGGHDRLDDDLPALHRRLDPLGPTPGDSPGGHLGKVAGRVEPQFCEPFGVRDATLFDGPGCRVRAEGCRHLTGPLTRPIPIDPGLTARRGEHTHGPHAGLHLAQQRREVDLPVRPQLDAEGLEHLGELSTWFSGLVSVVGEAVLGHQSS